MQRDTEQTTAEADMEIIRSRRASSGGHPRNSKSAKHWRVGSPQPVSLIHLFMESATESLCYQKM